MEECKPLVSGLGVTAVASTIADRLAHHGVGPDFTRLPNINPKTLNLNP